MDDNKKYLERMRHETFLKRYSDEEIATALFNHIQAYIRMLNEEKGSAEYYFNAENWASLKNKHQLMFKSRSSSSLGPFYDMESELKHSDKLSRQDMKITYAFFNHPEISENIKNNLPEINKLFKQNQKKIFNDHKNQLLPRPRFLNYFLQSCNISSSKNKTKKNQDAIDFFCEALIKKVAFNDQFERPFMYIPEKKSTSQTSSSSSEEDFTPAPNNIKPRISKT